MAYRKASEISKKVGETAEAFVPMLLARSKYDDRVFEYYFLDKTSQNQRTPAHEDAKVQKRRVQRVLRAHRKKDFDYLGKVARWKNRDLKTTALSWEYFPGTALFTLGNNLFHNLGPLDHLRGWLVDGLTKNLAGGCEALGYAWDSVNTDYFRSLQQRGEAVAQEADSIRKKIYYSDRVFMLTPDEYVEAMKKRAHEVVEDEDVKALVPNDPLKARTLNFHRLKRTAYLVKEAKIPESLELGKGMVSLYSALADLTAEIRNVYREENPMPAP